jgi:hypothetical protein
MSALLGLMRSPNLPQARLFDSPERVLTQTTGFVVGTCSPVVCVEQMGATTLEKLIRARVLILCLIGRAIRISCQAVSPVLL